MQRARLKDIAEKVGCSIAVVSHVVNHSSGNITCRQELRERILRIAQELDYAPHYANRALKGQRSFTVGVFIPPCEGVGIGFAYESAILGGIERICREKAYDLLVVNMGLGVPEAEFVNKLNARRVDGFILLQVEDRAEWIFPLASGNYNLVAINYHGATELDVINFDDAAAGAMAVVELHKLGHRRIAYAGPLHPGGASRGTEARLAGFLAKCQELGITTPPDVVFDESAYESPPLPRGSAAEQEIAERIAAAILSMPPKARPTALVGCSDSCAMLVMRALQRAGAVIPDQISVVGIDDSAPCTSTAPRLSSVQQPLASLGEEAARYIIQQAQKRMAVGHGDFVKGERWFRQIQPKFIARESAATLDAK